MWSVFETIVTFGLALGFGLLLLGLRWRGTGAGRTRRLLEVSAALAAAWSLVLGGLAFLAGDPWPDYIWRLVVECGLVVLAVVMAEFGQAFALRPPGRPWRILVALLLIGAALILEAYPWLLPADWARLVPGSPSGLILLTAWLFFSVLAWAGGLAAHEQAMGAQHRNRIRYLLLALSGLALADVLMWRATAEPPIWTRSAATLAGLALRLAALSILALAVLRHRLPDVRRWLLGGVRLALNSGVVLAILLACVVLFGAATTTWTDSLDTARRLAPALALGSLLAALIIPAIRGRLDGFLLGRDDDLRTALRRYGQQVNVILDLGRLADLTLDWVEEALRVDRSAFILLTAREEGRVELRIACAKAVPALPDARFAADGRFLKHFDRTGRPLSQYDLDLMEWFRDMPANEREWLSKLGIDLYVPVLVAGRPAALLALGTKGSKQPYSEEDLEALLILAGQTATALDNARLVDDLRHVQDDLERLGSQLTETNRQLQRLDQAKSDFVAIAAHELRTPLSQIYGYSDVLTSLTSTDLTDAEMVHQFIDGISRGAMWLKRVVDAMIDMSLIETGSLMLHFVLVPIAGVVKSAADSVQPAAEQRQLKLVVQDLTRLPFIEADSVRLEQALVSLLTNAVKFTPDGGEICVNGHVVTPVPGQEYVELHISDTGIGIDPEQQDLIFGKFYRAEKLLLHSSSEARFKGAGPGLGLAIARGIVEAHGGRIWVESPGRDEANCPGSTFHVRLPVKRHKGA